jgi:cation transport ATPase
MLERIIRAVSDASGKKAPLEKAAERLTGVFVPIVVYISIVVLAIWMGVTFGGLIDPKWFHGNGGRPFFAIEFAISVLVVASLRYRTRVPCANAVGNGLAAAAGILASGGGEAFTGATQVTTIAFDKTGTLTVGKSVVTDEFHKDVAGVARKEIVHALRDVEAQSTHPRCRPRRLPQRQL